jgi:hypothetical protein
MLAHGFTIEQMVELDRARLATASPEPVAMGPREIEVARVKITEAGRRGVRSEILATSSAFPYVGGVDSLAKTGCLSHWRSAETYGVSHASL